ncbi:MAG TPA: sigma-70 family RNA polymerase sigma factor [Novosphingobium sp.]|nr:sigma-70 family RNA polymerase sigma factor [Novosphingobium sp.]
MGDFIVARSAGSEPKELDRIYRRYGEEIRRYVWRTFGAGPPAPEDVVQAVFEKCGVYGHDIVNSKAFLKTSARNYVIDQHRRMAVSAQYERDLEYMQFHSDDLDAERVLLSKERLALLEKALDQLDARAREMLLMNRIEGLSCAEIARRRGCSATLVKSIIARALVACHRAAGEE